MRKLYNLIFEPLRTLKNITFRKLFVSQAFSLFGDAFTWLGLALLSYELSPKRSAIILSTALMLRVLAYIIFSPFAGAVSEHFKRKNILLTTQIFRVFILLLIPLINGEWQLYILIFLLNIFAAFFTPTYRAIIPNIVSKDDYRVANGFSMATFQLLSVFGPALAGVFAVWLDAKLLFVVSGVMLIVGVIIILTISKDNLQKGVEITKGRIKNDWKNVINGVSLLFRNKILRFSLSIEFVSAIAGALVLVNTVTLVKTSMQQNDTSYGLIMALFGLGGAITSFIIGSLDKSKTRALSLISGSLLLGATMCFANIVSFNGLLILWIFAGIGQSLSDLPSETLIGEQIETKDQAKVYGSHFAFSHLWWFIAYPLAGYLGSTFPNNSFLIGGIATIVLAIIALIIYKPSFK